MRFCDEHWLANTFHFPLSMLMSHGIGGMTANRRTRVRGLYDIDGKIAKDCVIGFFCNQCTLMQSDREIRAREADINLNVLKMGGKPKTVSRQPGTRPEMSYAPPDSGIINLDRLNDENRNVQAPLNSPGKKLQKYYQPMSPKSNQATPVDPQVSFATYLNVHHILLKSSHQRNRTFR